METKTSDANYEYYKQLADLRGVRMQIMWKALQRYFDDIDNLLIDMMKIDAEARCWFDEDGAPVE